LLQCSDISSKEVFKFFPGQESINHFKDHIFFFGFKLYNEFYLFQQAFIFYSNFIWILTALANALQYAGIGLQLGVVGN
jgi:hypothetical protein